MRPMTGFQHFQRCKQVLLITITPPPTVKAQFHNAMARDAAAARPVELPIQCPSRLPFGIHKKTDVLRAAQGNPYYCLR